MSAPKYKNPSSKGGVLKNLFKDPEMREVVKLKRLIQQKLDDPKLQKKAADIISSFIKK